jgi:hypothetical protein
MTESPDLEEELVRLVAQGRLEEALEVFEAELVALVLPGRDDGSR